MSTIALMGTSDKAGYGVARNLKDNLDYTTFYVEISEAGIARLAELGVSVTPQDEALGMALDEILAERTIIREKESKPRRIQLK